MTPQEAIQAMQFYKEKLYNGIFNDKIVAFDAAISALEKQIPKKPNIHGYREGREINTISYTCPVCNKHIGRDAYCKHCGTALDWSDTE